MGGDEGEGGPKGFKVAALNLFHPTASPLFGKTHVFVLWPSPPEERTLFRNRDLGGRDNRVSKSQDAVF